MTNPRRLLTTITTVALLCCVTAGPAHAQTGETTIDNAISNLQELVVKVALTAATVVLALAGLRYVTANGDTEKIEQAKTAFKGAAVGYSIVILAGGIMGLLRTIVGGQ